MWNQEAATSLLTCTEITSSSDVCFHTLNLFIGWPRAQAATFPTSPSRTRSGRPARHRPVFQVWLRVSWGEEPCPGHFTRWRSPCPGSGRSQNLPHPGHPAPCPPWEPRRHPQPLASFVGKKCHREKLHHMPHDVTSPQDARLLVGSKGVGVAPAGAALGEWACIRPKPRATRRVFAETTANVHREQG